MRRRESERVTPNGQVSLLKARRVIMKVQQGTGEEEVGRQVEFKEVHVATTTCMGGCRTVSRCANFAENPLMRDTHAGLSLTLQSMQPRTLDQFAMHTQGTNEYVRAALEMSLRRWHIGYLGTICQLVASLPDGLREEPQYHARQDCHASSLCGRRRGPRSEISHQIFSFS